MTQLTKEGSAQKHPEGTLKIRTFARVLYKFLIEVLQWWSMRKYIWKHILSLQVSTLNDRPMVAILVIFGHGCHLR